MAREIVTSENRQEFMEKKLAKMNKKPKDKPTRKNPSEMTMAQLMKQKEKADETARSIRKELMEAGMGQMKHSETMEKDHPIAKKYAEHSPYHDSLMQELKAREEKKYGQKKDYIV
jgi:hypothetical protein